MQEVVIRPTTVFDAAAVAALAGQLGYPTTPEQAERRFGPILADDGQAVLVAEFESEVVGWIHVRVTRLIESEPFAELGGFVVDETHRGRGLGRLLMAAAEEWAREHDIPRLRIRTRSDRTDAHAFYTKRGYRLVKEQRIYDKEMA